MVVPNFNQALRKHVPFIFVSLLVIQVAVAIIIEAGIAGLA